MAKNINIHRLIPSMAFSLLVHSILFFIFNLFLQLQTTISKENKVKILEVRLIQSSPQKIQSKPIQTLLENPAHAQSSLSQVAAIKNQDGASPSTIDNKKAPSPIEKGTSIIKPYAGAIPFSSKHDPVRTYQQQETEANTRHNSEIQAQLMIQQLQKILAKRLDVIPLVSGKCVLLESDEDGKNRLKCDSSALYEVLYKDQKNVAEALIALRTTGRFFNGFSVEIRNEKPLVTLSYGKVLSNPSN